MSAAALLSEITHMATRLQSASMQHATNVRELRAGDSGEGLRRESAALLSMSMRLAKLVGYLQASIASEVRSPMLPGGVALCRVERPEPALTDSEGGHAD